MDLVTKFEIEKSEATKWECASSDGDGGTTVTELHRVFVRLKPRAGPGKREMIEAMIASASKQLRQPSKAKRLRPSASGLWQVVIVADPHFGKYAGHKTTGHDDYDLSLAQSLVGDAAAELLEIGDAQRPERRTIAMLGDLFHYDTPHGTTTSGTPLERDGRLQKMIEVGSDCLLGIIEHRADRCGDCEWQSRRGFNMGISAYNAGAVPPAQERSDQRRLHRATVSEPWQHAARIRTRPQGKA